MELREIRQSEFGLRQLQIITSRIRTPPSSSLCYSSPPTGLCNQSPPWQLWTGWGMGCSWKESKLVWTFRCWTTPCKSLRSRPICYEPYLSSGVSGSSATSFCLLSPLPVPHSILADCNAHTCPCRAFHFWCPSWFWIVPIVLCLISLSTPSFIFWALVSWCDPLTLSTGHSYFQPHVQWPAVSP